MSYSTAHIRNVALAGHPGAGKTTLFEALLQAGGAIPAAGSLERGTTVSDFDPMEKARGHSLNTALASIDHDGLHLNLIDTPGYPDFRGPTLSAFSAVETVAIVVNAGTGIEYGTRRMMDYAKARNLCRMHRGQQDRRRPRQAGGAGRATARRPSAPSACRSTCPPTAAGAWSIASANTDGDSDLGPVSAGAPAHHRPGGRDQRTGDGALPGGRRGRPVRQELHDAFEQCLREGHLVPICFVSARTGAGVGELLDLVEKLMPNPAEGNPPPFVKGNGAADPGARPTPRRT